MSNHVTHTTSATHIAYVLHGGRTIIVSHHRRHRSPWWCRWTWEAIDRCEVGGYSVRESLQGTAPSRRLAIRRAKRAARYYAYGGR